MLSRFMLRLFSLVRLFWENFYSSRFFNCFRPNFDRIVFTVDAQNYELLVFVVNSQLMKIEFDVFSSHQSNRAVITVFNIFVLDKDHVRTSTAQQPVKVAKCFCFHPRLKWTSLRDPLENFTGLCHKVF